MALISGGSGASKPLAQEQLNQIVAASASATPYLDIAAAYEQQARQQLAQQEAAMAQQLAQSQNASNRDYGSAAAGNYINYMKQRNALPEQLAAQGIRGGASETAMVNMGNNYALTRGNTEASRIAALGQLQSTYDTNVANLRQQTAENIANNNLAMQQAQAQYEDTLAQRAVEEARYQQEQKWKQLEYKDSKQAKVLEQYAATISRYTSTDSIDKAIKKLKKSKPANYKQMIWLLQQRKAELNGTSSGGSGGGRSGGGYSGGGSSSGGSGGGNGVDTAANVAAAQTKGKSTTQYYKNAQKKQKASATKQKAARANLGNYMEDKNKLKKKGGANR